MIEHRPGVSLGGPSGFENHSVQMPGRTQQRGYFRLLYNDKSGRLSANDCLHERSFASIA